MFRRYASATAAGLSMMLLFAFSANATNSDLYVAPGPIDAVNLLSKSYPYEDRMSFVIALRERLRFYDAALENWHETPEAAYPEAKDYSKRAQSTIAPLLDKAKSAFSKAESAGEKDWTAAQAESRKSFLELQSAYRNMHGNLQR